MDHYSPVLRKFLENLFRLWFQRIQEKLDLCAEALDQWLHELFSHPTPDWRDRFEQFLAEQEAAGYIVKPQSRRDLLDWLEGWAASVGLQSAEGRQAAGTLRTGIDLAPHNFRRRPPRVSGHLRQSILTRTFFYDQLREARVWLDQMERVLAALGQKLDAAEADEEVEVEPAVDAIEALIWQYNQAMEKARDTWLEHNLGSHAYEQLARVSSPTALNLPRFVDKQQAERATQQEKEIGARLGQRIGTLDRVILGMQIVEGAGTLASVGLGGGALLTLVRQGGKWVAVKTAAKNLGKAVAVAGSAIAAEQAAEHGLRAAGVSEGTIRGARLAAEVVGIILLRRRIRNAGAKNAPTNAPEPTGPKARPGTQPTEAATSGTRPGSISDNPSNRLVETGVPLKSGVGWQKRWTRMSRDDELRQAAAISDHYEKVLKEATNLPVSEQQRFIFGRMRRFRTQYRRDFLKNRRY